MCELCGCKTYIDSGKRAVIERAEEIVKQLKLTSRNVEAFEDCERIAHEAASYSFPSYEGGEILDISRWVYRLHESTYRNSFPKYLDAAKDVFRRLPVKGNAKETITEYHQLEQLGREITDADLASIRDDSVREAIKVVKSVHDNNLAKKVKLKERYGLG